MDKNRTWCPAPDCGTICHICQPSHNSLLGSGDDAHVASVHCPSCQKEFCSRCQANSHPGKTCAQNGEELVRAMSQGGGGGGDGPAVAPAAEYIFAGSGDIKPCPMCRVPIERDAGCAQMMCKRCKHVFCWFCLTSLDVRYYYHSYATYAMVHRVFVIFQDDFLLRHYDSGRCKGKLGHSRASVLFHRAQVIGIFAGFGILLLIASPLLLIAAPCILCCRCKLLDKLDAAETGRGRGFNVEDEEEGEEAEEAEEYDGIDVTERAALSKQSSFEIRPAS